MGKIDLKKYREYVEQGYISEQKHPEASLIIWNYTHKCQFDRVWTEETMTARGLITDLEGKIIAKPFKKFFNIEEHTGQDSKLPKIPNESFEVFDKLDGSLGILYFDNYDQPKIATRGSFTSDQAIKASRMLHDKYWNVPFSKDGTYLFEIIYPENKIVVDYGETEDLFLLTAYNNNTGEEMPFNLVEAFAKEFKIPIVKRFDGVNDIEAIERIDRENAEGFVVRFKSGMRVKMKYAEYVRLHRLITGVNAKTIWELLRNKQDFSELLERVPDEFYKWVKDTRDNLIKKFEGVKFHTSEIYKLEYKKDLERREVAERFKQYPELQGILFAMLDKKDYEQIIWKMLRPKAEKPFTQDIDS